MVSAFLVTRLPLNTPEPDVTPSIDPKEVQKNLNKLSDNIADPSWWVNEVLPGGIKIAIIIIGAIFLRALCARSIKRLVERSAKKQLDAVEASGEPSSTQLIAAQRSAQRFETLGSLFRNFSGTLAGPGIDTLLQVARNFIDLPT